MNYFLSGCTENLGVLPLLLFSAFLLDPAFLALSFLLILVIVVLDDIFLSFRLTILNLLNYLNLEFLTKVQAFVKGLFLFSLLGFSSLSLSAENFDHIILSRGEQREVKTEKFSKFSLGNPEVISVHSDNKNALLIKAKAIGFSDIALWTNKGIKKINIFVVGKSQYLKNIQSTQDFTSLGLKLEFQGKNFVVKGEIETLNDWNRYKEIKSSSKTLSDITISDELKKSTIVSIYEELLKEGVSYIDCHLYQDTLECEYSGTPLPDFYVKKLLAKYPLNLHHNPKARLSQNFRLRFKIVQIEHYTKKSLNLGLNKVATTLRTLLQGSVMDMVGNNQSLFSGFNGNYELLSEPSQLITMGEKNLLEIGSEIPYVVSTMAGNDSTNWKFAGIRVETILSEKFQKYTLKYDTTLTRPSQDSSISGSKESSLIYLNESEFVEIFELNFKTNSIEDEHMPLLGEIPILKHLFSSNGRGETYKQIIGFVKLERVP